MNLLTLAALLQFFLSPRLDLRILLFVVYGFMAPFLAVVTIVYTIQTGKIDQEFEATFRKGSAGNSGS